LELEIKISLELGFAWEKRKLKKRRNNPEGAFASFGVGTLVGTRNENTRSGVALFWYSAHKGAAQDK